MKNEQLNAQAQLAADILRTGHMWEYRSPHSKVEWQKENDPDKGPLWRIYHQFEIRLSLATPGDGRVLHNPNSLTAEQVGAGWRLVLPGEITIDDMQVWRKHLNNWEPVGSYYYGFPIVKNYGKDVSLRLPLSVPWPEEPKVDPYAELKAAWESGKRIRNRAAIKPIYIQKTADRPTGYDWSYSPEDYEIESVKPEPKMVPLEASDVLSGSVFRPTGQTGWCNPIVVGDDGVGFASSMSIFGFPNTIKFETLMEKCEINQSVPSTGKWDATAWMKCEKEVC
jgi:hypothetical protein